MPRIPAYQRVASIPGPQGMAMPRATPAAMGSLEGAAMERGGANISDYVLDENDKKSQQKPKYMRLKLCRL